MGEIVTRTGNMLDSNAEILVNPVNCIGVMGAGLARQFKARYPEMYKQYRQDCLSGRITTGRVTMYRVRDGRTVAAFPTKNHWENPSKLEYVREGLKSLRSQLVNTTVGSIAVPALGSGLGGLDWRDVRPLIVEALQIDGLTVELYEPRATPRRDRT